MKCLNPDNTLYVPHLYDLAILIHNRIQTLGPNNTDDPLDEKRVSCEPPAQGAPQWPVDGQGRGGKGAQDEKEDAVFRTSLQSQDHRLTGGHPGVSGRWEPISKQTTSTVLPA